MKRILVGALLLLPMSVVAAGSSRYCGTVSVISMNPQFVEVSIFPDSDSRALWAKNNPKDSGVAAFGTRFDNKKFNPSAVIEAATASIKDSSLEFCFAAGEGEKISHGLGPDFFELKRAPKP